MKTSTINCSVTFIYNEENIQNIILSSDNDNKLIDIFNNDIYQFYTSYNNIKKNIKTESCDINDNIINFINMKEINNIEEKYKFQIDILNKEIEKLKLENDKNNDLEIIKNAICKNKKTSTDIGIEGENKIKNVLDNISSYNNNIEVIVTNGITDHGDLSVKYNNYDISVEVKNYKNAIPNKEIEKFYKAMDSYYNAGIFISLNTEFANNTGIKSFDIKMINNKPIVFISCMNTYNDYIIMIALNSIKYILDNLEKKEDVEINLNILNQYIIDNIENIENMNKMIETQIRGNNKIKETIEKMKHNLINLKNIYFE